MFKSRIRPWLVLALTLIVTTGIARHAAAQLYFGEGTWASDDGRVSGTWRGTIDAAGEDLSGDLTITGIPGLSEARIDGTWYPGVIDFALIQWESEVASITGTITADTTVSGTFVMPVPVTGTWQGQIMLVPDDFTLTPIPDDSEPAADATPTPGVDELTPEEQALLDLIDQAADSSTATPTLPPGPSDGTATPEPSPVGAAATATPTIAPTPTATATPLINATPTPTATPLPTQTPPDGCQYVTLNTGEEWTTFAVGAEPLPTFTQCVNDTGQQSLLVASFGGVQGLVVANMLLGWDTSELPPGLVVANSWLRAFVQSATNTDQKGLSGDWYPWGPGCDETDHTNDAPTGALSTDGACGAGCDLSTLVPGQDNDFPLDDAPEHVDRDGMTYLRLHVATDQVTGLNAVQVANSSNDAGGPRLVVLLCAPTPTASPTETPSEAPANTPADTPTDSPAPTPTPAPTPGDTPTAAPTPSDTARGEVQTPTETATPPLGEPTPTEVPTPTDSPTPLLPDIPTMTPTPTALPGPT